MQKVYHEVMKAIRAIFFSWLPLAGATTGILIICYSGIQQNYRQSLNDPQIQMAESAAFRLGDSELHASVADVVPTTYSDFADELAPWLAVYDGSGNLLGTSGTLVKADPAVPIGVLLAAKQGLPLIVGHHVTFNYPRNENRVTWQPEPDVRQAIIIDYVPSRDLFVVAGRNMSEVEKRIGAMGTMFVLGWLGLMAATLFAKILQRYFV